MIRVISLSLSLSLSRSLPFRVSLVWLFGSEQMPSFFLPKFDGTTVQGTFSRDRPSKSQLRGRNEYMYVYVSVSRISPSAPLRTRPYPHTHTHTSLNVYVYEILLEKTDVINVALACAYVSCRLTSPPPPYIPFGASRPSVRPSPAKTVSLPAAGTRVCLSAGQPPPGIPARHFHPSSPSEHTPSRVFSFLSSLLSILPSPDVNRAVSSSSPSSLIRRLRLTHLSREF